VPLENGDGGRKHREPTWQQGSKKKTHAQAQSEMALWQPIHPLTLHRINILKLLKSISPTRMCGLVSEQFFNPEKVNYT
jgi:hypothetical protein